tara:strand:- start:9748 stop:10146 length:399 start_codon:yes stop_codon:yes gene_type:complete
MLKTAFRSLGIMFLMWAACAPVVVIPGVHFLLVIVVPLVPFVAAYRTAKKAKNLNDSVGVQGLTLGLIVALIVLLAIIILLVLGSQLGVYEFEGRAKALVWIIVFIAPLYSGSMSALGFMYGALKSKKLESD